MRNAFITTLIERAAQDDKIWLLCGDLGYSVLEQFAEKFPARFINVGVAEQNMVSIAAGLALTGRTIVCYSIGNFATLRCYEQIRNDVCVHNANVKIVAVGGGLAYGAQGVTHHAVEDIAAMRALPGMNVIAPGDPVEARLATAWMLSDPAPCYLRLNKAGEPKLHSTPPEFARGKMIPLRNGTDILLISTGAMLGRAVEVADALAPHKISAAIASCPFVKPLDENFITRAAQTYKMIVTLEEHGACGGFGEAVAGVLVRQSTHARLLPFSIPELALKGIAGSQSELLARVGLDTATITAKILTHFREGL